MSNKKRFDIDLDRCVGCYACVVTCKDQNNDNPNSDETLFRELLTTTKESSPSIDVGYASIACMHCEDAPCMIACPTGAISKDEEFDIISVDKTLCIGCHSCALACPFSVPKFDDEGKMQKCTGCIDRINNNLIPACVRVCPTNALIYDTEENIRKRKQTRLLKKNLVKE